MSVTETLLIFVGLPAAIIAVIAALVFVGGVRGGRRYRPGRSFDFTPVWFMSAPEQLARSAGTALPAGVQAPALAGTEIDTAGAAERVGVTGGASDRW